MNLGSTPVSGVVSGALAGNSIIEGKLAFGEAPNAAREGACAPQK